MQSNIVDCEDGDNICLRELELALRAYNRYLSTCLYRSSVHNTECGSRLSLDGSAVMGDGFDKRIREGVSWSQSKPTHVVTIICFVWWFFVPTSFVAAPLITESPYKKP